MCTVWAGGGGWRRTAAWSAGCLLFWVGGCLRAPRRAAVGCGGGGGGGQGPRGTARQERGAWQKWWRLVFQRQTPFANSARIWPTTAALPPAARQNAPTCRTGGDGRGRGCAVGASLPCMGMLAVSGAAPLGGRGDAGHGATDPPPKGHPWPWKQVKRPCYAGPAISCPRAVFGRAGVNHPGCVLHGAIGQALVRWERPLS